MNHYEALKHAVKAHAGQLDKCGQPYVLHPIAVAEAVEFGPSLSMELRTDQIEALLPAALLHDVWEDTDYVLPIPETSWLFGPLAALTRMPEEPYGDYVERVCGSKVASIVKLADIWHNLQPERQACLPEKERKSLKRRYLKARAQIWAALGYEWWPS